MIEHEPIKVYLKIKNEKMLHEVRLYEFEQTFNRKGEVDYFYAAFEMRHNGERYFFDSRNVDIEDILAEYKIEM